MSWLCAIFTKIARRIDNPVAKMMLPKPIHHHAGRQRIVGSIYRRASCAVRDLKLAVTVGLEQAG